MRRLPRQILQFLLLVTAVAATGCRDRTVLEAPGGPPRRAYIAQPLVCEATSAGTVSCQRDGASVQARSAQEAVARVRRTPAPVRGQMHAVTLGADTARMVVSVTYPQYTAAQNSFSFGLSIENRMSQPLGSVDGQTADTIGIRYFLEQPPITTQGTGVVSDSAASGTMTGPNGSTPYWHSNGVVLPRQEGGFAYLVFRWPSTVRAATFRLMVLASLPDESDDGLLLQPQTWQQIALGEGFGCGLRTGGAVYCWGANRTGTLADGAPVDYGVLTNFVSGGPTQVALGLRHGCAVVDGGRHINCWGVGAFGQDGVEYGYAGNTQVPFPLDTTRRFTKVVAGDDHTCAVTSTSELWCWGSNTDGQLGASAVDGRNWTATQVNGGWSGIRDVALGHNHSCVVASDRKVWCWGGNEHGQLQDGTSTSRATPALVSDNRPYLAIAAGGGATCGVADVDGGIYCWGDGSSGLLGTGVNDADYYQSELISTGYPAHQSITVGAHHVCALAVGGEVACWGDNTFGQLGLNTRTALAAVSSPAVSSNVVSVAAGAANTCVRYASGSVQCWGANYWGQSDPTLASSGVAAAGGSIVANSTSLAVGANAACATVAPASLFCWGDNASGVVSTYPGGREYPTGVLMKSNIRQITAGNSHACALDVEGRIWCWGSNAFQQVGRPGAASRTPVTVPESLTTGDRYTQVKAGAWHTCAIRSADSTMVCWGDNAFGQLGTGTVSGNFDNAYGQFGNFNSTAAPTPVTGALKAFNLEAGGFHTCARVFSPVSRMYCWGRNDRGQLGTGTTTDAAFPVQLTSTRLYDVMALGDRHSCGIYDSEGMEVFCWGDNRAEQIGIGNELDYYATAQSVFYGSQLVGISAGLRHSCALRTVNYDIVQSAMTANFQYGDESELFCWGTNDRWEGGTGSRSLIQAFDEQSPETGIALSRMLFGGAASSATCMVGRFGQAYCWGGDNASGQMGSNNGRAPHQHPNEGGPVP